MNGDDVLTVVVVVAALLVVLALGGATIWFVASVRGFRRVVVRLTDEIDRAVVDLRTAIDRADGDLDRADDLLGRLEEVNERVDAASELAVDTFSRPVIRAVSFGSGTARAARRLRRRDRSGADVELDGPGR